MGMFSLFKLPCYWRGNGSIDAVRWIYSGNVFFRTCSHFIILIISILNALYRTKPSYIWNHKMCWKISTPIMTILAGLIAWLIPVWSHGEPDWVRNYHTYCWIWYEPQLYLTIIGMSVSFIILAFTLSVSVYSQFVSIEEANKLNEDNLLHSFISERHSPKMLGQEKKKGFDRSINMQDLDDFYKKELGIDLCFRMQSIVVCELLRLLMGLVFLGYIVLDPSKRADQSFYLLHLISTFLVDSQGFITFLAFCVSDPFWSYIRNMFHFITCGAFRKSNPISEAMAPSKYAMN